MSLWVSSAPEIIAAIRSLGVIWRQNFLDFLVNGSQYLAGFLESNPFG